jgi:hypothetical protein
LRVAGLVNLSAVSELTTALIGINIESRGQLSIQLEKLTALEPVHWAAVVTGRFDVIAEVIVRDGTEGLYRFHFSRAAHHRAGHPLRNIRGNAVQPEMDVTAQRIEGVVTDSRRS